MAELRTENVFLRSRRALHTLRTAGLLRPRVMVSMGRAVPQGQTGRIFVGNGSFPARSKTCSRITLLFSRLL